MAGSGQGSYRNGNGTRRVELSYRVQYCESLAGGIWLNAGTRVWATGTTSQVTVPLGTNGQAYYRILRP